MNILYVYAHPNPQSLNQSIKTLATATLSSEDISLKESNLYDMQWNAVASDADFDLKQTSGEQQYFVLQKLAYDKNKFSPDIAAEQGKVVWADHIIFQFPIWWFSAPAILKGWFDRVIAKGFAYDVGKVFNTGKFSSKTASVIVTTQSPESAYQKTGLHGESLEFFLTPIFHTLRFTGINVLPAFVIYDAINMTDDRFAGLKQSLPSHLRKIIRGEYNQT